jgi:Calcineurin-like phosphoesterase
MGTKGKLGGQMWRVVALAVSLATSSAQLLNAGEKELGQFSFVVLGHIRSGDNGKVSPLLDELLVKVRRQAPDLIFLTGDMIWGDVRAVVADADAIKRDWDRLDAALDELGVPVYRVPGNHDINDRVTRDIYFARYGQLPQAFTYRGSRFILLNSSWVPEGSDPPSLKHQYVRGQQLGPKQIEFIRKELSEQHRYNHVFLFMHHLLWWHKDEEAWWRDVHPLLVGRNVRAVFGGDLGPMKFSHMRRDGIDYLQAAIEGTADIGILREWNSSRLLSQQFDNYLYVTVAGPHVGVEVRTIGEISTGNFTPQRWRALDEYEPPLSKRVWNVLGNTQRLMALLLLIVACFVSGFIVAVIFNRHRKF